MGRLQAQDTIMNGKNNQTSFQCADGTSTYEFSLPRLHLVEMQQMVFTDVICHGFEPDTAHESLLDARGDLLVDSTTPEDNGRKKHQQVTR